MQRSITIFLILAATLLHGCGYTSTEALRNKADFRFKRGEYHQAVSDYSEIVARYPGDWRVQQRLGECYLEIGDPNRAREALEVAHSHRPINTQIIDSLAEAMFRQGDETRLFAFLRARAESTQSPAAYLRLARFSIELNDPDSAKLAIDTAIVLDDARTVEPYFAAANLAQRVGNIDDAIFRLRQALGVDPKDKRVLQRLDELGEIPGPTLALPPGH